MKREITLMQKQDTGWINLSAICSYRVLNQIVYLHIYSKTGMLKVGDNILGTIPSKYKPNREIIIPIQFMGGVPADINPLVHSRINAEGTIAVYLNRDTNHIEGFTSYPLG